MLLLFFCFVLVSSPHSLINCYEHFASQISTPTLLAALGAITTTIAVIFGPVDPKPTQRPTNCHTYGSRLILSPAEAPVPQKLSTKFDLVNLRELLADNISVLEQLHS